MNVIVDTGPLVALLNRRDEHHEWATTTAAGLDAPLHTCEAVLAEGHYLLSSVHDGTRRLSELVEANRLDLSFRFVDHTARVHELMRKYASVPMSFADACLVALSETFAECRLFTVDSDFDIYRRKRNRRLDLISPPRG